MSSRYTANGDTRVDRFVDEQLREIVREVRGLMGRELEAVVLGGGFGRGEGSVRAGTDGSLHVVNDFDIEIVPRGRFGTIGWLISRFRFRGKLERLATDLAERFGMKQIDLGLRAAGSYASVCVPRLADFDLKYGHQLLYGVSDPVASMPAFAPGDIPAFEGTWLLRNRGVGLLLASLYLDGEALREEKREYFHIEINKAVLAMGDALFLLAGRYTCSYAERAARIREVAPDRFEHRDRLLSLYAEAVQYKLAPRDALIPTAPPASLWRDIAALYLPFVLYYESRRLGERFRTLPEYERWAIEQPRPGYKQLARVMLEKMSPGTARYPLRLLALKHDRPRSVLFTMAMLASLRDEVPAPWAKGILNRLLGTEVEISDRRSLSTLIRDYLMLIHPSGELARFLAGRPGLWGGGTGAPD
jgi:hypothetical protein